MITIIIADDEKLIRAGLKKILQQELDIPLHIIEAKNGQEALRAIEEHRAELLITDIRMSVMDGIELMKLYFESPRGRKRSRHIRLRRSFPVCVRAFVFVSSVQYRP